jgi:hypothetical protein
VAVDDVRCGFCHKPARGFAEINGSRYCHDGASPTCYELVQMPLNDMWDALDLAVGGETETTDGE